MSIQEAAPTTLNFHFDPLCPFAWRTALWAREARKVRPITINWHLFSLEIANRPQGTQADYVNGHGWIALRTLALARRQYGNEGMEKLYIALGNAQHGRKENISNREVVEACTEQAGFTPALVEAVLADETTIQDVLHDHEEAVTRYRAFGVPTLALEGSELGYFGPVILNVPQGQEAGELWDYTAWALQNSTLFELKRDRPQTPLEPIAAE